MDLNIKGKLPNIKGDIEIMQPRYPLGLSFYLDIKYMTIHERRMEKIQKIKNRINDTN